MTDEEFAAIKAHITSPVLLSDEEMAGAAWSVIIQAWRDRAALLAEVEAWRELGQQVAEGNPAERDTADSWRCYWCDANLDAGEAHGADCTKEQARALLGIGEEGATQS